MKAAYKYTDGTNEKFFDVLYIEEDGITTLEHHNSQRTISWPARIEDGQFGQVVRYGKGSSIPFTDKKGNMLPRWSVLTAAVPDGTTEGTPAAAEATETATPRHKRGHRKTADEYGRVVVPMGTESPSDATETATDEIPNVNDEATAESDTTDATASDTEGEAVRNIAAILSIMTRSKAARELAKGFGILAALAIIWQTGLLIPFALLGGVAAGVVK